MSILLLGIFLFTSAQPTTTPKREVRAVWLTTLKDLDWPKTFANDIPSQERQKRELRMILDKYQEANINTVLLQAVDRASTIYPSVIYPWDACMTGHFDRNPGYDPLAFAIEECHKRGMEVQAWIATLPVGPYYGPAAKRLRSKGYKMFKFDSDAFLDPSSVKTGELIASVAREITTHYDIDGIHLDYIRYPEMLPSPKNEYIAKWRRNNITNIVREVHNAVKAEKPWVKISCSPIGKYSDLARQSSYNWNARDRVSQDAQLWLRLGLMDQLYPMIYFRGNNYFPFAADWAENTYGKTIAAGLGTYFLDPREGGKYNWTLRDIAQEMLVARQMGLGTAHFRSYFLTANFKGIFDFSSNVYAPYPALIPAMTWQNNNKPFAPTEIKLKNGILKIENGSYNDSEGFYYNIYASDTWPVDISDPRNIVLTRYQNNIVKIPTNTSWQPQYYAVTVMDRYGNESDPVQSWKGPDTLKYQLTCNGKVVYIEPSKTKGFDCTNCYIQVSNMQGQVITRQPVTLNDIDDESRNHKGQVAFNVSKLNNGIYILSLYGRYNKKRMSTKRLGFFIKKQHQN